MERNQRSRVDCACFITMHAIPERHYQQSVQGHLFQFARSELWTFFPERVELLDVFRIRDGQHGQRPTAMGSSIRNRDGSIAVLG